LFISQAKDAPNQPQAKKQKKVNSAPDAEFTRQEELKLAAAIKLQLPTKKVYAWENLELTQNFPVSAPPTAKPCQKKQNATAAANKKKAGNASKTAASNDQPEPRGRNVKVACRRRKQAAPDNLPRKKVAVEKTAPEKIVTFFPDETWSPVKVNVTPAAVLQGPYYMHDVDPDWSEKLLAPLAPLLAPLAPLLAPLPSRKEQGKEKEPSTTEKNKQFFPLNLSYSDSDDDVEELVAVAHFPSQGASTSATMKEKCMKEKKADFFPHDVSFTDSSDGEMEEESADKVEVEEAKTLYVSHGDITSSPLKGVVYNSLDIVHTSLSEITSSPLKGVIYHAKDPIHSPCRDVIPQSCPSPPTSLPVLSAMFKRYVRYMTNTPDDVPLPLSAYSAPCFRTEEN
jgi:hypothetical protein